MQWIATCPQEAIDVLASELKSLGIEEQSKLYREIMFDCDLETAYRAYLPLRTASRIQRVVAEFDVTDLASALKNINWPTWLRSHKPFTVQPTLSNQNAEKLDEDLIIKTVVQSIQNSTFEKSPPKFDPNADRPITIVLFIRGGTCVLGIDTAGRAIHKRGWRTCGHPAVLKETLAASILMLAGYNGNESLLDPMCGSGTIARSRIYCSK